MHARKGEEEDKRTSRGELYNLSDQDAANQRFWSEISTPAAATAAATAATATSESAAAAAAMGPTYAAASSAAVDGGYAVSGGCYGDDAAADDDVSTTASPLHGLLPTTAAAVPKAATAVSKAL